jgi:aspartate/methionine/tyrosine aminotransferase
MKPVNHIVHSFNESIFSTITQMSNENKAINLAQGFPDFDGPKWIIELAMEALQKNKNQYAPSMGILPLREAIAGNYEKYYHLKYQPKDQILVTNGATEALYATITALINPGDEVVIFEPFYDSYLAALKLAQAKIKVVTLHAPEFKYDLSELKAQISDQTKLLILNTPHNPTGKVFNLEELQEIAYLSQKFDFTVLSDEVYEFLTFDCKHIPIATLDQMQERVVTISSIGKTLSLTGWKIGWVCGPGHLIKAIHHVHQFVTFCVAHPLQEAMAKALPALDEYLKNFKKDYQHKRNFLVKSLTNLNYEVLNPNGTYFALTKVPSGTNDVDFCKKLILEKKVAVIPVSAFYLNSTEGSKLVRFCFAKTDETLNLAMKNLGQK